MEAEPKLDLLPHIVVVNIMKHLSIKDLRSCQTVSPLWNDLAIQEIYRRPYFVPFSHVSYCRTHRTFYPKSKKSKYRLTSQLAKYALNECMKGIGAVSAQTCITFVTDDFANWYKIKSPVSARGFVPRIQQEGKMLIRNTLMCHLPRGVNPQLFVTNGLVSWSKDGVPLETEDGCGISGVMIPDDPELKIYSCGPEDIYESKQDNLDKCSLLKKIPKDVEIKCLLLFSNRSDVFRKCVYFVEACQDRQSTTIAVGGMRVAGVLEETNSGVSDEISESDSDTDSDELMEIDSGSKNAEDNYAAEIHRIFGNLSDSDAHSEIDSDMESNATMVGTAGAGSSQVTAFCGESVEAASVAICSLDSEESIIGHLSKFQEIELRKKKCFAFMFRNRRRGFHYYKKPNYESSIFHRLYPDVPLIGAFGKTIIGTKDVPDVAVKSVFIEDKAEIPSSRLRHSHRTVFVFIAI